MKTANKEDLAFILGMMFSLAAVSAVALYVARQVQKERYINGLVRMSLDRGDFERWESE